MRMSDEVREPAPPPAEPPEAEGAAPWTNMSEAEVNRQQRDSLLKHFEKAREENEATQATREAIRVRREQGEDVTSSILLAAGLGGLAASDDEPGAGALAGVGIMGLIKGRPSFRPTAMTLKTVKRGKPKVFQNIPDEEIADIILRTDDAVLDERGLTMKLKRHQDPAQSGHRTIRGGVFYMPEPRMGAWGSYSNANSPGAGYGGRQLKHVEKTYRKPLIVEGTTGGPVPEVAYNVIKQDPDAYARLDKEIHEITKRAGPTYGPHSSELKADAAMLLHRHGVDNAEFLVSEIVAATGLHGNHLRYALQESIIAQAAKNKGYDAIIGIGPRKRRFSEVFDLTDEFYPMLLMGLGGGAGALAVEGQSGGLAQ
jgi:hypothetical protein